MAQKKKKFYYSLIVDDCMTPMTNLHGLNYPPGPQSLSCIAVNEPKQAGSVTFYSTFLIINKSLGKKNFIDNNFFIKQLLRDKVEPCLYLIFRTKINKNHQIDTRSITLRECLHLCKPELGQLIKPSNTWDSSFPN